MVKYTFLLCLCLSIVSCTKPQQETVASQEANENSSEQSDIFTPGYPITICDGKEAQLMHASWIKSGHQPPHLLRVRTDGRSTDFDLGIDRSPDFQFREADRVLPGHHFFHAHSRLIAYSCQREDIQILDLSLPDNFAAQDAQSGMIKGLKKSDTGSLLVDLTDVGEIEFRVMPTGLVRLP